MLHTVNLHRVNERGGLFHHPDHLLGVEGETTGLKHILLYDHSTAKKKKTAPTANPNNRELPELSIQAQSVDLPRY